MTRWNGKVRIPDEFKTDDCSALREAVECISRKLRAAGYDPMLHDLKPGKHNDKDTISVSFVPKVDVEIVVEFSD